jgi:prepilin-type N-terminal cleavage/methylation domain-containing protein
MKFPDWKNGFTLVEIIICVALLGIIAAPLLGLLSYTLGSLSYAREETTAVNLARELMEDIKGKPFSTIINYDNYREEPVHGFSDFSRKVNIRELKADLLEITITVSWKQHKVELVSLRGNL